MNNEEITELIDFVWAIAKNSPEPIRHDVFQITYSKLLETHIGSSLEEKIPIKNTISSDSQSLDFDQRLYNFALKCNLSVSELKDIFYIDNNLIYLIHPLNGSESEKQTIATQCILTVCDALFGNEWVESSYLMKCVDMSGVGGMDHFARNMRKKRHIRIRGKGRGNLLEYKITAIGKLETFSQIHDLVKGDQ